MYKLKKFQKLKTATKFLHLYKGEYDVEGLSLPYEIVSRKGEEEMFGGAALGHGTDAVCIVPFFENGDVLATKEFRYALNAYCLEFPAGLIEAGESPVEAAIRELKEETGLDTKLVLFSIPGGFSSAGMTDEKVAVVGLEVSGEFHDVYGKETIHSFRTTLQELWERMMDGGEECSSRMQCFLLGCQVASNPDIPYSLLRRYKGGNGMPKPHAAQPAWVRDDTDEAETEPEKLDPFDEIAENLRDYPEGEIWSDGNEILCKTESAANAIADMLQTRYRVCGKEVSVNTGYYDPEEDKRNGEDDWCTGWWYVSVS